MTRNQQLDSLLSRRASSLAHLHQALEQEYSALTGSDIQVLEDAVAAKDRALEAQAELASALNDLTAHAGVESGNEGIQTLIAASPNEGELNTTYAEILALAQQCRDANRINGRLIAEKRKQAELALNIVRQTEGTVPTYSEHGATLVTPSARSFGKA